MNMEEENKQINFTANFYQNEQIEQAKATLLNGLKVYPNNNLIQDLLQQCQEMIDLNIQRQNKKIIENKLYSKTELVQKTNNNYFKQDIIQIKQKKGNHNEIEQKLNSIAKNSFQMRLKVLIMEINVVETFWLKKLMENENEKTHYIKSCIGIVNTALDVNDYKKVEEKLLEAESLSTEVMKKIKMTLKKKTVKKVGVKKFEDDILVPDYRSIVTVRGDNKDVINCILKAKTAFDNCKYDSAERLLVKAERIRPTKNARDLLKQVRAAKEIKQNSDTIEIATEAVEHVSTLKEKDSNSEGASTNAAKCLIAFENAFSIGNFEKAERMLNKAKRLKPSLDVGEKLSQVNAAKTKKIMEDIRKEEIEKAARNTGITKKTPHTVQYKSGKDEKKEKQHTEPLPKKEQEKKEKPNTKPKQKPKEEQVKNLIIMAENEIHTKKFDEAMNFLNIAEEMYPTEQDKELQKHVREISTSREETYVPLNCYELPVGINESDKEETLKCIQIAQAAFEESQYDKAEHFPLKSLRICDSQRAKSLLETVRNAKAQYNTNVETENNSNNRVNNTSLNDTTGQYNKSIDLATNAIAEENLDNAKHCLLQAIEINANENARKQLEHIQYVRKLQPSNDEATTSEPLKSYIDLKRERDVQIFQNFALDAIDRRKFHVARDYLTHALEILPNEQIRALLREVEIKIECRKGLNSQAQNDIMFEANKLLEKAENNILHGNLELAESLLIVSWYMYKSCRTKIIYEKFLKARLALFRDKGDQRDGRTEYIIESDQLVLLALHECKKNELEEAVELLRTASKFCPSVLISKLLVEVREVVNKKSSRFTKACNYIAKKFS